MAGPAWLSDTFAAMMLVIAAYCALRLVVAFVRRRETEADTDGMHVVMGVAMAGMLVPRLSFGTQAAWTIVFSASAAWFAWQAVRVRRGLGTGAWRCPFPLPHLAESLAMIYMVVAVRTSAGSGSMAGMAGMGGMGAARAPELAVLFTIFMVGYVAWLGDRFNSVGVPIAGSPAAPALVAASAIATEASFAGVAGAGTLGAGAPAAETVATETADACALPGAATLAGASASAGHAATQAPAAPRSAHAHSDGCWPILAPRGACCYKLVMAIVMAYMLVIML